MNALLERKKRWEAQLELAQELLKRIESKELRNINSVKAVLSGKESALCEMISTFGDTAEYIEQTQKQLESGIATHIPGD